MSERIPTADREVFDNTTLHRYEIDVDGVTVGFTNYRADGEILVFPHTQIEEAYSGQGLAQRLIRAALDDVRRKGVRIRPLCPAVAKFIQSNSDYADLVAE